MSKPYECQNSDHIAKVAAAKGFFKWETLWEPNKDLRSNPNLLFKGDSTNQNKGDTLEVPDKTVSPHNCDVDFRHFFTVPRHKLFLRVRILKDDFTPIQDSPYELVVEGVAKPFKDKTKSGLIEHQIPFVSSDAELTVRVKADDTDPTPPASGGTGSPAPAKPTGPQPVRGDVPITWKLRIGKLNPIKQEDPEEAPDQDCISGMQQRLNNLDLNSGPVDGILGENTKAAIKAFQTLYQVNVIKGQEFETEALTKTQEKLFEVHDKAGKVPTPPPPASDNS
jgi:hypothetical protein